MYSLSGLAFGLVFGLSLCASVAQGAEPPRLKTHGTATQLMVDGAPYLILGGEVGNSTASDPDYLLPVWAKLKAANLNTVLLPVEWDQVEPVKGRFDFSRVDAILAQARTHDMRVVVLWFGVWKNSMSTYVPAWVKRDGTTFSRARDADGGAQDILSAHDPDTLKADQAAFKAFMAHLKAHDTDHRVIMIQIENEIGMLPTARDHSAEANKAYASQVPSELMDYLKRNRDRLHPDLKALWAAKGYATKGSWAQVFGTSPAAEEVFQAWGYARFADGLARAGKSAFDMPMYVNAALNASGKLPGAYPSAGPLPHLFDVWKAGAPSVDLLAIDLYWPNFTEWTRRFKRHDNPVFIPEANQAGKPEAIGNAYFAFGELDAMGFSPFSIENLPEGDRLGAGYKALENLTPLLLASQGKGVMRGFKAPVDADGKVDETPQTFTLGGYGFKVTAVDPWTPKDKQNTATHGGLIIQTSKDEFMVAGTGVTLTFFDPEGRDKIGIEQVIEGRMDGLKFVEGRWLNGDETHQGRHLRLPPGTPGLQRLKLYRYR